MLSLLLALSAAAQPPTTTAPATADRKEIPLTLILSGGVSLGSYEAGLSWAVTRIAQVLPGHGADPRLGRVRLVAVTGASAGSVNALISAALWCLDPVLTHTSVDDNPLRNTWLPIGLDRLLPDVPAQYQEGDGLLSSRPLVEAFDRLRDDLLSGTDRRLFTPGCRLPIGITVTRSQAEEQQVAGLTVRTQRFVLPWLLEVTAEGMPRFVSLRLAEVRDVEDDVLTLAGAAEPGGVQALPFDQVAQGLLASAAFPAAFSPRVLCDCSSRCPAARQETSGSCPGPSGPIDGLSCPARSPRGEPLALCSRQYVDGGIFDNAPVGLAIDLTEATYRPALLQPVNYLFVDPDLRRLSPAQGTAPPAPPGAAGLERVLRLLGELAATGRSSDLSRIIRASGWNRTTSRLLYRTVAAMLPFFSLNQQLGALATGAAFPPVPEEPKIIPTPGLRAAGGRVLLRCIPGAPDATPRARERLGACAREIRLLFADPGATPEQAPLSDDEVIRLAQLIASNVDKGLSELARPDAVEKSVLGDQQLFIDRLTVGAAALFILAEELPRVVRGPLPDARLRQLRDSLLQAAPIAEALGAVTAGTANVLLLRQLARLEATPRLQAVVARTRAVLANVPRGDVFTISDLRPLLDELALTPDAPAAAVHVVQALAQLGPALQAAINRTNGLSRDAWALAQSRGGERALVVSTRFAPIVGSQLANFGAFLDVPLREFDYYAGVYDASHAFAVFLCGGSVVPGMTSSVRRSDQPDELDLAAPETQRCLGEALQVVAASLDLQRSSRATLVLRALARVELAASLDSSAAAEELLGKPAWRWLEDGAPPRAEDASLGAVAGALLSARAACSEHSREPLCVRDLTFAELIQALQERGYQPVEHNMQAALSEPAAWGRRTVRKALDRSVDGERGGSDDSALKGTIQRALGVGELWMRGFTPGATYPRLDLDPSSIPGESLARHDPGRRLLAHLIPYRIGLDVHEAGISLSWVEPALRLSRQVSLMSEVSPIDYEGNQGRISSTIGLLPTVHVLGTSFSAGPRLSVYWADGNLAAGGEVRVGFLQDRLAFGFGARDFPLHGRNIFILVSLADLNGTAYWLLPGLGR